MRQYLDLMQEILREGAEKEDRTGTGTFSLFGKSLRFDLREGFPLVTTKKMFTKGIIHELLWFISGDTNIKYLNDRGVHIWDEWADVNGNLGPVYGRQWRKWEVVRFQPRKLYPLDDGSVGGEALIKIEQRDQLATAIRMLQEDPDSRRNLVSAWNVGSLDLMALQPCHVVYQFYVENSRYLSMQMYQRSADYFLGVPFNIASYALLLSMVAQVTGLEAKEFIHVFGDVHVYRNHVDQCAVQLSRDCLPLPRLELSPDIKKIDDFGFEDVQILDYKHHPKIEAPISV